MRVALDLLCAVGLYVAAFMFRKARLDGRGLLAEPSVVQSPRARALGGVPNAAIGVAYYPLVALASFGFHVPGVWIVTVLASLGAAAFSIFLAYSLLFVTKRPCPYCWTGHLINWVLPVLLLYTAHA